MNAHDENTDGPVMEIRYDPAPGFRPVFWLFLLVAVLYLAILFFSGAPAGGH